MKITPLLRYFPLVLTPLLDAAPTPPGFVQALSEQPGPGVTYQRFERPSPSPLVVHVTEADLSDPRVQIRGVTANDRLASGRKTVQNLAKQQAAKGLGAVVAAVNGDYFDFESNYTTSASVHDGVPVYGGRDTAIRSTFALNTDRTVSFGINYVTGGTIRSGKTNATYPLHGVNVGRSLDQFILYTPYYGSPVVSAATPNVDVREALLRPLSPAAVNSPMLFEVVNIIPGGNPVAVPDGHYLLSASRGLKAWFEANINEIGQEVEITVNLSSETKPLSQLIGGGPRLLTEGVYSYPNSFDGAENVSHAFQLAARTAVGITPDNKLLLVVVDNSTASGGATLVQLADILLSLGATNAMNLDGGGSSTMVAGTDYALRNSPSDGSQRSVVNAIVIETEIPLTARIADLDLEPAFIELPLNGSVAVRAFATDQSGVRFPLAGSALSWTSAGIGNVSAQGVVSSVSAGYGILHASAAGFSAGAAVAVDQEPDLWGWRVSAADGNLSVWPWFSTTDSYARGLALGLVSGTPRLALMNRATNTFTSAIEENSPLVSVNRANITGGTYSTNDVEYSDDGVLFAANLTTNAATTAAFRVYQWNDGPSSAPTRVIDYTGSAHRLGDKITVVGSVAARTATIYAAAATSSTATAAVLRWVINPDGTWPTTPTLITLAGVTNVGGQADIAPLAPGPASDFWINGNGFPASLHSATGALLATMPTAVLPITSNAIAYLEFGGRSYLAAYLQGPGQENARVIDLTNGVAQASVVLTTAPLGTNANTAGVSGDVDWVIRPDQSEAVLAVLATNNGAELIGLPNPANRKPVLVLAASSSSAVAAPYTDAAFWVASTDAFASDRTIQVNASGAAGLTIPSVTLPAGRRFVKLPFAGTPASAVEPIVLTGTLAANSAWIVAAPGTASLTLLPPPAGDSFSGWISSEFSPAEQVDPAISGPTADPDGLGWPNLLRYALGIPRDASASVRQTATPSVAPEAGFLTLSYLRPRGSRPDVNYVIEASTDLATWTPLGATPLITPVGEDHELVEVTDTVVISSTARRFLRLRVALND